MLADLHHRATHLGLRWVVMGAAARDLVHLPLERPAARATKDVDIAIAVEQRQQFHEFAEGYASATGGEHKIRVCGVEVESFRSAASNPTAR